MEKVFEPVTAKHAEATEYQKQISEKHLQALRDSSQTTRQTIEHQTRAIQERSNNLHKNLQKSIKQGIQDYEEITNRNIQLLTSLVNSNKVDSSIAKTVINLLNDKNKSRFCLEPINDNPNLFTINSSNLQQLLIKLTFMTFLTFFNHTYDLHDPVLQFFITNTQFVREINNVNIIFNFSNDLNSNINNGDKNSMRYYIIKNWIIQYYQQSNWDNNHLRSGLNQFIFLPSDPDELKDQLKLLYFEKKSSG